MKEAQSGQTRANDMVDAVLTCVVFIVVLGGLASCLQDQEMFTESESLYQTRLSLLKERPEENRTTIAVG